MTVVLVHGNPETDVVWDPLVEALTARGVDDVVRLSPPGFGAPTPAAWPATPAAYVRWLLDQLTAMDGPIDLVGHDWGAGHVLGLLAEQPSTVRSWAADCLGLLHPDYVWHDMAQLWQTPDAGEEAVAAMLAVSAEDRAEAYVGLGLPQSVALPMAAATDEEMGRCILDLYRAAAQQALVELGQRLLARSDLPPGLAIVATDDAYVAGDLGAEVAARLGADQLVLDGNGHWWMTEDPATAAQGLIDFWSGLPSV